MVPMVSVAGSDPVQTFAYNNANSLACFSVTADSDPGILSRVLEPVVKRGLTVERVTAVREAGPDPVLVIDMQVAGLDQQAREVVTAVLAQIVGVRRVLACEKLG